MSKKYIVLIAAIIMLAIIPSAMAATFQYPAFTVGGTGGSDRGELFNLSVYQPQNLTALDYVKQDSVYCWQIPGQDTTPSTSFTAYFGQTQVGTGTISGTLVDNVSATAATYDIELSFDTWDNSAITGAIVPINLSYDVAAFGHVTPNEAYGVGGDWPGDALSHNATAMPVWRNALSDTTPNALRSYMAVGTPYIYNILYYETPAPLSLHASETGNFSHKLEGVSVSFSNGQSGTTNANGTLSIDFAPKGTSYTFTATKDGYTTVNNYPLGDYGTLGGDLYFSMSTSTNGTWVRTYVSAVDANTGNPIYGSNIDIRNVTSNIWRNSTADADGVSSILTESTATLDMYVSATGYISGSRTGQPAFDGMYEVPMWFNATLPDPGEGNVNLIVYVHDSVLKEVVPDAGVAVVLPSGATLIGTTSDAGGALFQVPNTSSLGITAYKSGYKNANTVFTTTAWGPDTTTIEITKLTVTQTPSPSTTDAEGRPLYDADGNPITYDEDGVAHYVADTRTDAEKDADMMDQLREAGPNIISLCILAIMFGLLRMIFRF